LPHGFGGCGLASAAGAASFPRRQSKLPFSHGLGQGERALVFDFADSPQLAQHLASWSVVENIRSYFSELLPVVPLADCIFYLAQPGDELLLIGVFGHLQHVSQFFDLEPIRIEVPLVQAGGTCRVRGKLHCQRGHMCRCSGKSFLNSVEIRFKRWA
jgi:hypothetical protein